MTGNVLIIRHHFRVFDPASWLSFLIQKIDNCWANHCAIVVYIGRRKFVVEARGSGIYLATWENWLKHRPHKSFIEGHCNKVYPADMQSRILSKAGVRYDTMALFFWHPLKQIFGRWWGGNSESGKLVCSEYVALCWKEYFPEWRYATTRNIIESNVFVFPEI